MKISIYVYLTDKRAKGRVVYVDSKNPFRCGIELARHKISGACLCRPRTGTNQPLQMFCIAAHPPKDFAVGGRLLSDTVPLIGRLMKRQFG
jgi:hypothetical protein